MAPVRGLVTLSSDNPKLEVSGDLIAPASPLFGKSSAGFMGYYTYDLEGDQ